MPPYKDDYKGHNESTALLDDGKRTRSEKRQVKEASRTRTGVVLAACLILQVVSNGLGFGLSVMYVEIMRTFNASRSTAALIQSLFMAITTAGGILWAPVLRRFGPGICAFAGCLMGCAGFIASAFSTSIYMIIVLTGVLASMGMCVSYLAPFITASAMLRERAGVALVFLTTGSSIGQFIFPFTYELFISEYGWTGAFILLGGLALQCAPASCVIYGSRDYMISVDSSKNRQTGCAAMCNCDWRLLAKAVILLLLFNCFLLSTTGNIEAWFLVDIMTLRGFERETGSLFVSLMGLFNFFGRSTGVFLRLKVRVPTIYHWIYCFPILAIGHVLVLVFTSYWPLLLSCLLYGFVFGIVAAQTPAIMLEAAGIERYPDGMAFVNVFYGCGNLFGGSIGGIIKDTSGTYDPLFYLAVVASLYIALASVVMVILLRRRDRRRQYDFTIEENPSVSYRRLKVEEN